MRELSVKDMKDHHLNWHCRTAEETAARLQSNASCGLSRKEARSRYRKNGPNTLFDPKWEGRSSIKRLFSDPAILLFFTMGVLSLFFGEAVSGGLALGGFFLWLGYAVLFLWSAQRRNDDLWQYRVPTALVVRSGRKQRIRARRLVIGDLILLRAGDIAPADIRLVACKNLQARLTYASVNGETPTVFDQRKNAEKRYHPSDPTQPPAMENMVYGGSEILSGSAIGLVVACSEYSFFGAMRKPWMRSSLSNEGALKGILPYLRLFGFLSLAAMLPISVVALLIAPEEQTALRVFFPICAWAVSASAMAPQLLLQMMLKRGENSLLAMRKQGNGAAIVSNRVAEQLPELTDLFILGKTAFSDGVMHARGACNGIKAWTQKEARCRDLTPLAEAFWLKHRAETQKPTVIGHLEPPRYLQELMAASEADPTALELSVESVTLARGEGEAVLEIVGRACYRLRFCYGLPRLSALTSVVLGGGAEQPMSNGILQAVRRFQAESARNGCRTVTVIREQGGFRSLVGVLSIGAMPLSNGAERLEELRNRGIRVYLTAESDNPAETALLPLDGEKAVYAEASPDLRVAAQEASVLIGYSSEQLANYVRYLRGTGRRVGVIVSELSHRSVAEAADLLAVCDSYHYHGEAARTDAVDHFNGSFQGTVAPQILRRDAHLILSGVSSRGGGLAAFCTVFSVIRGGILRAKALLDVLLPFQLLRTAVFLLSVLFGMATVTAVGMVIVSLLTDLTVYLILADAEPQATEKASPLQGEQIMDFFRCSRRWLMPLLPAVLWTLLAAILHWTGVLELSTQPTLCLVALLLMQTVLLLFVGKGIRLHRGTVLTCLKFLIPVALLLLLSALIPRFGALTELGGWSAVSLGLALAAPVLTLLSVMLFSEKKT